jgi:hypothetical protein
LIYYFGNFENEKFPFYTDLMTEIPVINSEIPEKEK